MALLGKAVQSFLACCWFFIQGTYWQVGDVVSVVDEDDGKLYYAQIRGFLQDQFNNKSAVLTWLLPTSANPPDGSFDPATFVIGMCGFRLLMGLVFVFMLVLILSLACLECGM